MAPTRRSERLTNTAAAVLAAVAVAAAPVLAAELSVGVATGVPGSTVLLPVSFTGAGGGAVAAQFEVTYDPARLATGEWQPGPVLATHRVASGDATLGARPVVIYSLQNAVLPDGIVAQLPVVIPAGAPAGNIPVQLAEAQLADVLALTVAPVKLTGGRVEVVTVLAPKLDAITRGDDGVVKFTITGPAGLYYVDASPDLATWTTISTNRTQGGSLPVVDASAAALKARYYRARLAP